MPHTVSAIVCAYNEEKTVHSILETLCAHPQIYEVVAVDDGSRDKTVQQMRSINHQKLMIIRHQKNLGKGAAMADGVHQAKGDILLFIDADLRNFDRPHIELLLEPLIHDPSIMTIGVREVLDWKYEQTFRNLIKSFGGERAIGRRFVVPLLRRIRKSGYGAEAILNLNHLSKGKSIKYIPLPHLRHEGKPAKHPIYMLISTYIKENAEIIKQYLSPENKALEAFLRQLTKKLGV